ncbi:uncharacterized protein AB675_10486 [Cyphellophora attinorum]|uniref:Uncharacterized protein n=1 Tax=Cyphellophora attinorum TaxID=1664694 RepID=A0A0N0NIK9_9EURO|nr:uncharacterized protein AB675_10486 [Phialophora attinorum]KPI35951.1 hypothetical protein AB675_10486 [Phialophora attinorum]
MALLRRQDGSDSPAVAATTTTIATTTPIGGPPNDSGLRNSQSDALATPWVTSSTNTGTSSNGATQTPKSYRTINITSIYLDFSATPSPIWLTASLGNITFPANAKPYDIGSGSLTMQGPVDGKPWNTTPYNTSVNWKLSEAEAWTSSKRKERRQRRDTHIRNTFDPKLLPLPFPDVAQSTMDERKDSDIQPEVPPKERRPSTQLHPRRPDSRHLSIDGTSVRTTTSATAKRASVSDKRQSFPTMLLNNRPRRALSTSAGGLISPVAAAHQVSDEQGLETVVKHLRTQISTLFEQIEMHVDNFYQASTAHGQALSRTEQDRLRYVESPHLEDSIVALLPAAEDTRVLIKHCLTEYITSRLDYTSRCEYDHALLPRSLLAMYRLIAASNKDDGPQELARWRIETLGLLGLDNVEKSMASTVRDASERVTLAFRPWIVKRYSSEARSSHLASIFREAVELGLEIFGMHGRGIWVWESGESSGQIVLCPGFNVRFDVGHDDGEARMIEVLRPMLATP